MNADALHTLETGGLPTADALARLLTTTDDDEKIIAAADRARAAHVGDVVRLRALIEIGSFCKNHCLYCGLRAGRPGVKRFRLSRGEILDRAERAAGLGYQTIVLQSGDESDSADNDLVPVIRGVKELGPALTLSVGEKSPEQYARYKEAGADRYLLRIETGDRELYARLHPSQNLDDRLACLRELKAQGYELGTGLLVGLPGQSALSLARDLLFFREIGADMIGVGPFIPVPGTPLAEVAPGSAELTLKVVALIRLLLPRAHIPATTALEVLSPGGRLAALKAGADVIMPNLGPDRARRAYDLYPGKAGAADEPAEALARLEKELHGLGRKSDLHFTLN